MIWAIERGLVDSSCAVQIVPEVPRKLAAALSRGAYDTAIVSVFEYYNHPDFYSYIEGPVIAGQDKIYSVLLVSPTPWENLHTVYLDAASLTSVNLFKVLTAEKGLKVQYLDTASNPVPSVLPDGTGWVVIGDPAIAEHDRHSCVYDLGSEWKNLTGLPFVFAAWLVPTGTHPKGLVNFLDRSLEIGLQNLEQVAIDSATTFGVAPEFALRYFREHVHYRLGVNELHGWNEFGKLCHKHHLISTLPELRPYREN